ncbi:MAG TPA: PLP-dependent transferase [Candidatus Limnocylindrales bacterium]|nr:PLP-dependent transferase [Candidatus Limnocylindrales bacterium]
MPDQSRHSTDPPARHPGAVEPSVAADWPGTAGPGGAPGSEHRDWRLETLAVHAGLEPDELTGAVAPPIYQTSTYEQEAVGRPRRGYEYARTQNPTRERLERSVAALEGARFGLAFASGSATTQVIASLARPGERIVAADDLYGGTFRYFERVARESGVEAAYVDLSTEPAAALAGAVDARTRLVWLESPSNPLLKVLDIAAVAAALAGRTGARGERPILVVDNTFASPMGQRPLLLGADIAYHSATKYLAGHSDTVNGVLATSREDLHERLHFLQNAIGAVPGPFDCFLVLRGIRTLGLRMTRHAANALAVARALAERDDVAWLRYPGLGEGRHAHPHAPLAARQMALPGGMISFRPAARDGRSSEERARRFCEGTRLFSLAESLGGVESLVDLPALMTHGSVAGSALEVPPDLVRLSVGIEHPDDLVADVAQALDRA